MIYMISLYDLLYMITFGMVCMISMISMIYMLYMTYIYMVGMTCTCSVYWSR